MSIEETLAGIENQLERIADQLEKPPVFLATTTEVNTAPVAINMPEPVKKTKKVAKKKKPAPVMVEEKTMAAGATPAAITKAQVGEVLKYNVITVNEGDESVAQGIIDSFQEGATLSSLKEEHYAGIHAAISKLNNE